jgi:hypothetical protein
VTTIAADESLLPMNTGSQGVIYAGWHESLLAPAVLYGALKPFTLVSKSRDGEFISRIVSRLGWQVIRGSCRQNELAISATWNIMDALRSHPTSHFFLATDGPRGPRRVFKDGAIYLASRTQRPLVLIGVAHERSWRAQSWDRFVLPRPFARVCLAFSPAIEFPRNVNRHSINTYQQQVRTAMDDVQLHAEQCLAGQLAIRSAGKADPLADFLKTSPLVETAGLSPSTTVLAAPAWESRVKGMSIRERV